MVCETYPLVHNHLGHIHDLVVGALRDLIFGDDAFDFQTHVMPERSRRDLILFVQVVALMIIAIGPPLGCLLYALKDGFWC
jgi:hypothetical protein